MAGYNTIVKFRKLEEKLESLGMIACQPRSIYNCDMVAVRPNGLHNLPIYSRDAELFVGTIDQLELWIRGIQWSRDYDRTVFGDKHNKNRQLKEENINHKKLVDTLTKSGN